MAKTLFSLTFWFLAFLFVLMATGLSNAENSAFQRLYQIYGAWNNELGTSVSGAGDINGDGRDDFLVGAPYAPGPGPGPGSVTVYSGATGAVLYRRFGTSGFDHFGSSIAGIGDIDHDGKFDFIVGAPGASPQGISFAGSFFVYSGLNGTLLYQIDGSTPNENLGISVAGPGDLNGDGVPDFVIGSPYKNSGGLNGSGSVYAYSGATGTLIYQIDGESAGDAFGASIAGIKDVNGDGLADLVIGATGVDSGSFADRGAVFVYAGKDGALLYVLFGDSAGEGFGNSISGLGDLNGDGKGDFIAGASRASPGGLNSAGSAFVYSGASGDLLFRINGDAGGDCFGATVSGVGDVNGDGTPDYAVGAPCSRLQYSLQAGYACVFSGVDNSLLFRINGTPTQFEYSDRMGAAVSGSADINGDGRADFIIGDPYYPVFAGAAYVYGLAPTSAQEQKGNQPRRFELSQNYPNPFNPTTIIQYYLSHQEKVTLEIFNLLGEPVRTLVEGVQTAGEHLVFWDGQDMNGKSLSSGVYFCRLKAKDYSEVKRMIFLK